MYIQIRVINDYHHFPSASLALQGVPRVTPCLDQSHYTEVCAKKFG
jgi:hypothetical protein